MRALEAQHEASLGEGAGLLELARRDGLLRDAPQLCGHRLHGVVDALDVDAGLRVERAGVGVARVGAEDVVGEPAALAHLGEEARRHSAAEHRREQLQRIPVGVAERMAAGTENDVRLVGLLRVHLHGGAVRGNHHRVGDAGLARLDRSEQLLEPLLEPVPDASAEPDDHSLRPVPVIDERGEGLPGGGADTLLGADDVAAEGLIAVEEVLVDPAHEIARRVEVHVHLLYDHALLAFDLLGVES